MDPLKVLQEEVRQVNANYRVGLYATLLQLRFIVPSYGIATPERDLEYILMKQVYYRLFGDDAGNVYNWCLEKIVELFKKFPALQDPEHRNRLIEQYEVSEREFLLKTMPTYLKIDEIPAPWRSMILTMLDKIKRREYVIHDQTAAGSVAIWEGEFMKDVINVQNLRLLEKYMLISNIALFGYDVYLTFSAYVLSDFARKYLETQNLIDLYAVELHKESIIDAIHEILCKISRDATVEKYDKSILIHKTLPHGTLRVRIMENPQVEEVKKCRDFVIVLTDVDKERHFKNIENVLVFNKEGDINRIATAVIAYVKKLLEL